ncbi:DUF927 domain-containing protein [Roseinatronobacter monicus]|uniref:Uncharacterized protein DUF927 n=1 Tax=Roseinatronobacter monicus TaxID=393481 RepID=A0A543KBJ8_9RHOB|nr:DUF927 domain-containing protein [Roseinatronobacter monicus]TQM92437.1 uncharacterized protein DUF927 [Roseinatronobacter monicus]
MVNQNNASILEAYSVKVTRMARHMQDGSYYKGVIFPTPDGESSEHFIPNEVVHDTRKLLNYLSRNGMTQPADKKERAKLLEAIGLAEPADRCSLTIMTGWHGRTYVLPHKSISRDQSDDIRYFGALAPNAEAGSLDNWKDEVAKPLAASSIGVFTVVAALMPIIAHMTNCENAIFHISGKSGVGKTTLARVAASVWPGGHASLANWDSTPSGLQDLMASSNDGFASLDEFSASASDNRAQRKFLREVTYMLATGSTRRRSKHYSGGADVQKYRFLALSTGESTAASIAALAGEERMLGEEARFLDLPIEDSPTGIFDLLAETEHRSTQKQAAQLADNLNVTTTQYFGTAAPAFIRYVVDNFDKVELLVKERVALFNKKLNVPSTGWERRISNKFGLAYAVGVLAIDAGILPWSKVLVKDSAVTAYGLARSHLFTEADRLNDALEKLQATAKAAPIVDLTEPPVPEVSIVNAAPALRMRQNGKTVRILVNVAAFNTIGDTAVRDNLIGKLDLAGVVLKKHTTARPTSAQVTPIKGARRQSYMCFTRKLLKFELPN